MRHVLFVTYFFILSIGATAQPYQPSDFGPNYHGDFDPRDHGAKKFHNCKIQGLAVGAGGQAADTMLNLMKNRNHAPSSYLPLDAARLQQTIPSTDPVIHNHNTKRAQWPVAQRDEVNAFERKGVSVEGYIIYTVNESDESCNCNGQAGHDTHMWLGQAKLPANAETNPKEQKADCMVVEISPREVRSNGQPFKNWNRTILNKIAKKGYKVRISGWLMWDNEHFADLTPGGTHPDFGTRNTLWEIHPIHKIEVKLPGSNHFENITSLNVADF